MLKHTRKRLPMLKHKSKRLLNKHNYTEKCLRLNTWYTISGVHKYKSDTDSRISRIWKLLRNSKWTWCENNFSRVLALVKLLWVSYNLQLFTPLYRGVKRRCWLPRHQNSRCWSLIITNDLLLDLVIVLWGNNFKFIPWIETNQRSHSCSLVLLQTWRVE